MSSPHLKLEELNALAEEKEKELQEVSKRRITLLEDAVKEKEDTIKKERIRFRKLKEDFEFNVKLIRERDTELEQYEILADRLRLSFVNKEQEMSDVKIKVADLETKLTLCENEKQDLADHYNKRLKDIQKQTQLFQSSKQADMDKEREAYTKFKKNLENRLSEAKEMMESQRRQMLMEFEDVVKKKEQQHRLDIDEHCNKIHAVELKNRMLEREKELLKESSDNRNDEVQSKEEELQELKRTLKRKEWEIQDLTNLKDAKIVDLNEKLESCQRDIARNVAGFSVKHAEQSKLLNEREATLQNLRKASEDKEKELMDTIQSLKTKIDQHEIQKKTTEWNFTDRLKDKEISITRLRQELEDCRRKMTLDGEASARDVTAKDLEIESLREINENLSTDLDTRSQDLQRYKRDLSMALERERVIEQGKIQLELDWRKRCEEVERKAYSTQENLVVNLTKSKDEVIAQASNLERKLQQQDEICRVLKRDRDLMLGVIRKNGLQWDAHQTSSIQTEMDGLAKENRTLKTVIQQMRTDMEALTSELNASGKDRTAVVQTPGPAHLTEARRESASNNNNTIISQLEKKLSTTEKESLRYKTALSLLKQEFIKMQKKWSLEKVRLSKRIDDLESLRDAKNITKKIFQTEPELYDRLELDEDIEKTSKNAQQDSKVQRLQLQLRNAVKQIATLIRERDKLIQLASKQRSQLAKISTIQEGGNSRDSDEKENVSSAPEGRGDLVQVDTEAIKPHVSSRVNNIKVTLDQSSSSGSGSDLQMIDIDENIQGTTERDIPIPDSISDSEEVNFEWASPTRQTAPPQLFSSSSNVTSLGEVWKLLDDQPDFALMSLENKKSSNEGGPDMPEVRPNEQETDTPLLIRGSQPPFLDRHSTPAKQSKQYIAKLPKKKQKNVIRNYNIKDDSKIT